MYNEVKGSAAMGFLSTKPVMIVTTLHENGVVNAGVFGAYTNLSPVHLGAAIATTSDTYVNMKRTGEFVVNVPGADLVKALAVIADDFGVKKSEVEAAGLTTKDGVNVETPSIAECAAAVEFAFDREVEIGHHSFMIGEVKGGWIREEFEDTDGKIDIFAARVMKDFKYPKPLYVLPGDVVQG